MSDELAGGVVIDPDEQPAEVVQTPLSLAGEPAPTEEPIADEDEDVSDVPQIDLREGKFVPVSALVADRKHAKEALRAAKAEAETLRAKAQQADEMSRYVEDARPYIEALRTRPDLIRQVTMQPPAPVEQPALSPEQAEGLARTLELYTPDGHPDIKRAQTMGAFIDQMASRKAQQAVAPVIETEAARESVSQFQRVMGEKAPGGVVIDPKVAQEVWTMVPPQLSSQPAIAQVLRRVALAETILRGGKPAPQPVGRPPVQTEASGGRPPAGHPLSDIESRIARSRGMTDKQWQTARDTYRPGQPNVLE